MVCISPSPARAEIPWTIYTVQPGDALPKLAEQCGTTITEILHRNGLQSARDLYPGMDILLPERWTSRTATSRDNLLHIAQAAGVPWQEIALRNNMLLPNLIPGMMLYLPDDASVVSTVTANSPAPRLEAAIRFGVPWWQVLGLNRTPANDILLPIASPTVSSLPDPRLVSVTLAPQPITRGETARLTVISTAPLECTVTYVERTEPCYPVPSPSSSTLTYGQFIGLPALLEPGTHPVTLSVYFDDSAYTIPLTLRVDTGMYDHERFDLVPGGQASSNPELAAHERVRIAELRLLRTAERYGTLPFSLPVDASVTSYYGSRRSYGYGFTSYHAGTDFRATTGTPVYAPADGVVVLAEPLAVRGNAILIDHGQGIITGYWHLSGIGVEEGAFVHRGEEIGEIGNTGFSTGPHLHWELWVNGLAVSPLQWVYDDALIEEFIP